MHRRSKKAEGKRRSRREDDKGLALVGARLFAAACQIAYVTWRFIRDLSN